MRKIIYGGPFMCLLSMDCPEFAKQSAEQCSGVGRRSRASTR